MPPAQGLYDPQFESDSCGVAFLADLSGRPSHRIVAQALTALRNLEHRGAAGAEPSSGDGAGMTVQVPDAFLRDAVAFALPDPGGYAVGLGFLPTDAGIATRWLRLVEAVGRRRGSYRARLARGADRSARPRPDCPRRHAGVRATVRGRSGGPDVGTMDLERRAFCVRKVAERRAREAGLDLYFASLSRRTLVYKGMLTTDQLGAFFPDLRDERFASAIALVHSRFSTNTFPSWPLAHPFRYIAHNGEINTIRGNRNWMRTREATAGQRPAAGRHQPAVPDLHAGCQRLGDIRRGARTAAPRPGAACRTPC